MADTAPYIQTVERQVAAVSAGSDLETDFDLVDFDGTVESVVYVPATAITGADTDTRTVQIVNKGQAGAGTTVVAGKTFTSGVNAPADDATTITLSATAADLAVAEGDVLVVQSNHAASGLADPGGLIQVKIARS